MVLAGLLGLRVLVPPVAFADQHDIRLDGLFERLHITEDGAEVAVIQQQIWQIWIESDDPLVSQLMRRGVRAMTERRYDLALASFDLVTKTAPDFAEAWNKRATVHVLIGEIRASMADLQRTLELEPRHFGAWSALAVMYYAAGALTAAARSFETALRINPHLHRAKERLEELRRHLQRRDI